MFFLQYLLNFNNSNNIYNLFYVYIMYACMYMGFVPKINLFVFVAAAVVQELPWNDRVRRRPALRRLRRGGDTRRDVDRDHRVTDTHVDAGLQGERPRTNAAGHG